MKEFLAGWIIFQLVTIGLSGGNVWREEIRNGCVDIKKSTEIEFVHYWVPLVFPLSLFIDSEQFINCTTEPHD